MRSETFVLLLLLVLTLLGAKKGWEYLGTRVDYFQKEGVLPKLIRGALSIVLGWAFAGLKIIQMILLFMGRIMRKY